MKEKDVGIAVRRRLSLKERGELIAKYQRSGLTQRAFVQQQGISLATLTNWLRAHRQSQEKGLSKEVGFQSVDLKGMFGQAWVAEVVMSNGSMLRLGAQVQVGLAERLVKVLGRSC